MAHKPLRLAEVYTHMEPGPVVLLTTARKGKANVMVMSWHTMMEFEPPLIGCVVSGRNFSFAALKATKECVINIPTAKLAKKVIEVGNVSGREVDKFARFGLTAKPSTLVQAPRVEECYVQLECKVVDTKMVPRYNFFVLEVVAAWRDTVEKNPKTLHHRGNGVMMVAGRVMKLPSKMK